MEHFSPLKGILVVAIEQAVAAPYCTCRLADAGARVVKIERPGGDFARGYDELASGQSSYFVWLNRGKESLVLDLTDDGAREMVRSLANEADVLVQNLKPGVLERLGLATSHLRRSNPELITCSISGFGDKGPYSRRKAYDLLIQAEAGLASITGGPAEPARVGISVVDIASGAAAYTAILEALIRRATTGTGVDIKISMFDVIAEWMTVPLLQAEGGQAPKRVGLAHPSIAPYGAFRSKDGRILLISIQNEREWKSFCEFVMSDAELSVDPRFRTNVLRVENREAIDSFVSSRFESLHSDHLIKLLAESETAFAVLHDMNGLSNHPQLRRIAVDTPRGSVSVPAPPAVFSCGDRHFGPVPPLSEPNPAACRRLDK